MSQRLQCLNTYTTSTTCRVVKPTQDCTACALIKTRMIYELFRWHGRCTFWTVHAVELTAWLPGVTRDMSHVSMIESFSVSFGL